jgi:hypothetical protein
LEVRGARAAYGAGVGTTGLIFAAIAVAWLVYLVPHFVRRHEDDPVEHADPEDRFSDSVRILQHGTAPLLDQDLSEIGAYEVSTPLTRRAAINDLRRLERVAALRRRRVLLTLLAVLSLVVGVAGVDLVPWWSVAIPAALVVIFFAVSRVSVMVMRRGLDRRYAEIRQGGGEVTILLARAKKTSDSAIEPATAEAKTSKSNDLWDPVPITVPTYVSKPLAPRTVRTIDLSGPPLVTASGTPQPPVTADPELARTGEQEPAESGEGKDLPKSASA